MDDAAAAQEAQWLARAQAGDLEAFGQLVRRFQGPLRRQMTRLARGDAARGDDLAQQALVQAWRSLPGFRGDARLSTWLHRIGYMCFLQEQRRAPLSAPAISGASSPVPASPHDPAGEATDAESSSASSAAPDFAPSEQLRIDVERALARLPEAERVALVHCYHLDLSHEEAAQVLGLPLGTLKSHVSRGKAKLREWLADWRTEWRTDGRADGHAEEAR